MMGHSHALTGALVWLAAAPALAALPQAIGQDTAVTADVSFALYGVLTPAELIAGMLICAGAAMLPDLDHPNATIAHTFGPATWVLSKIVHFVSGGHRHATHSLLFAILAGVGAHWLAWNSTAGRDIVVILMIGLAIRSVGIGVPGKKITSAVVNVVITGALFWTFLAHDVTYAWLGFAIAIGSFVHVAGDCLTEHGCPVLWPWQARWVLPYKIGFKTGKTFEERFLGPVLAVVVLGLLYLRLTPVTG
ncbi:metal-dependent hydrolase [Streptosporangiaceae bacterium NEAU-GS5]|nr:metal-dependent hydrolase [Streptosporangiaceae bacterium NEAU-GS5]